MAKYIVLPYNVKQRRVAQLLKRCRHYPYWRKISAVKLAELLAKARISMHEDGTSLMRSKSRPQRWPEKQVEGRGTVRRTRFCSEDFVVGGRSVITEQGLARMLER